VKNSSIVDILPFNVLPLQLFSLQGLKNLTCCWEKALEQGFQIEILGKFISTYGNLFTLNWNFEIVLVSILSLKLADQDDIYK
jgi:hypothetical protein